MNDKYKAFLVGFYYTCEASARNDERGHVRRSWLND